MNALMLASSRSALLLRRHDYSRGRFLSIRPPPGSSKKPPFQIDAHVFAFLVLMLPVGVYAVYADKHKPDPEQLEEELRGRYGADIATRTHNNQAMQEFFRNAIQNPEAGVEDQRLQEVLYGGWGRNQKRFHAVDAELYGTKEGVELAKKTQEELQEAAAAKKKERRKRKKKKQMMEDDTPTPEPEQKKENAVIAKLKGMGEHIDTKQAVTVAVVGSIAAAAGFLLGGRRQ